MPRLAAAIRWVTTRALDKKNEDKEQNDFHGSFSVLGIFGGLWRGDVCAVAEEQERPFLL